MSESVAAAILTPVRTLSKSSDRSLLSSPEASAPGSPNHPGLSSLPELHAPEAAVSTGAASLSPGLAPHDDQHQNTTTHLPHPPAAAANAYSGASGLGTPQTTGERGSTATPANTALSSTPSTTANTHSGASGSSLAGTGNASQRTHTPPSRPQNSGLARRPSFGLGFLSSLLNTIRGSHSLNLAPQVPLGSDNTSSEAAVPGSNPVHAQNSANSANSASPQNHLTTHFMSNSPTVANLSGFADALAEPLAGSSSSSENQIPTGQPPFLARENTMVRSQPAVSEGTSEAANAAEPEDPSGKDKDGLYSIRLTPIIDHLTSNTGLYFSPMIRRIKPKELISIGRYTEKNKSAAHAPQGSSAPLVFKSKVVSRTHAMFQCNEDGSWFLKDCKSSSGTFLNNVRLSQASQELTLWPLIDGDVVQLGLDYRGGTEEVYRCVKMRCEFNRSWQRKVNQFNLDIHKKMKRLGLEAEKQDGSQELSECAICLLKLEPCQALFISPCSHSWHYKCIRPIIIKSYPQFYCPNCRSMCDLETDIEDE